jgi:hypothetical protein
MLTVVLRVTSGDTDLSKYTGFLAEDDVFVVVFDEGINTADLLCDGEVFFRSIKTGENPVMVYNEIVMEPDFGGNDVGDVMLLSDCVQLHCNTYEHLASCLHAAEKHAIACGFEVENKKSLIETAKKYLPEYEISIHVSECCAIIKRDVIKTLGFLDASYSSLYYALLDYYCRINKFGFSAVTSYNTLYSCKRGTDEPSPCSFVTDEPSPCSSSRKRGTDEPSPCSFGTDEPSPCSPVTDEPSPCSSGTDALLFYSRFPYREEKERQEKQYSANPAVEFLALLDEGYYTKKRILFDCIIMPAMHCGTSEFQISVFDAFYKLFKDKYDVYLYVNVEADEYFGLSKKYENVLFPDTITGTFHLGYAPNQLMFFEPLVNMNRFSLKIVQTMYDIMMVRIDEHVLIDVSSNVETGILLSDGIVFISNFTKNDFMAGFANSKSLQTTKTKVIYPATGLVPARNVYDIPFADYFLVTHISTKPFGKPLMLLPLHSIIT